ncbi:hypothetical protein BEN47_16740 [Hymenobacter lapidarius]|uniref:Uncharacterized protein n=1 Tax=Hymenobacter lapidarius TaxID=1908237 RepID=A0A1G1SZS4_9BACT|nr:hypothetical protein [Hymenobacter lapidarius]OGX84124.1 hypothetical protein BEN47_16740 [Hymenobacter lapidarius]
MKAKAPYFRAKTTGRTSLLAALSLLAASCARPETAAVVPPAAPAANWDTPPVLASQADSDSVNAAFRF